MINLETVLADTGQAQQKAVILRVAPSATEYLREIGVDVVNLANNHSMDYGLEGFSTTCATLESAGIEYVGVLKDGVQQPAIVCVGGLNLGILGYTTAGSHRYDFGIALLDQQRVEQDIADLLSKNVDRVIVNLHWGEEYVVYPAPDQQRLARQLIESGADVIIGHHPHVVQGIERYRNGVIFYSLGNFNFVGTTSLARHLPSARWGLAVLLNFASDSALEYMCVPVHIDQEYRPCFAPENEARAFLAYVKAISEPLKPEIRRLFWLQEASWPHFRNHLPSFVRRIRRYGISHFFLLLRWLISPRNYGFYLGLFLKSIATVLGHRASGLACQSVRSRNEQC
jgi:poly-gamma-glutamate synthesis protein (capsule biosynthesis protein)